MWESLVTVLNALLWKIGTIVKERTVFHRALPPITDYASKTMGAGYHPPATAFQETVYNVLVFLIFKILFMYIKEPCQHFHTRFSWLVRIVESTVVCWLLCTLPSFAMMQRSGIGVTSKMAIRIHNYVLEYLQVLNMLSLCSTKVFISTTKTNDL